MDKINTRNSSSKQEVKIKQPKDNYHWNFTIPKANGSGLTNNRKRIVLGSMFLNKFIFCHIRLHKSINKGLIFHFKILLLLSHLSCSRLEETKAVLQEKVF